MLIKQVKLKLLLEVLPSEVLPCESEQSRVTLVGSLIWWALVAPPLGTLSLQSFLHLARPQALKDAWWLVFASGTDS